MLLAFLDNAVECGFISAANRWVLQVDIEHWADCAWKERERDASACMSMHQASPCPS
jgi:hypothetical protein